MSPLLAAWGAGVVAVLLLALPTWAVSLGRRDASLIDRFWGPMILAAGVAGVLTLPEPGPRAPWLLGLAGLWALRLAWYITRRNWGQGEDRRYQAIRARNQPHFALKSLVYVYLLQALLATLVALPLWAGAASPAPLGPLDALGLLLAALGLGWEALADAQMAAHKARPAPRPEVFDQGLWAWCRHPNYFGESLLWWGLGLVALAAGAPWALASPLLMIGLLLKVSGVALLDADQAARKPAYRDYMARTPAFFPRPPRRPSPAAAPEPRPPGA